MPLDPTTLYVLRTAGWVMQTRRRENTLLQTRFSSCVRKAMAGMLPLWRYVVWKNLRTTFQLHVWNVYGNTSQNKNALSDRKQVILIHLSTKRHYIHDDTCSTQPTFLIPTLTFYSLSVSLRTTRLNIQNFYIVLALFWEFSMDLSTDSDFCFVRH